MQLQAMAGVHAALCGISLLAVQVKVKILNRGLFP